VVSGIRHVPDSGFPRSLHDPEIRMLLGLVTEAAVLISGSALENLCPELAAKQTQLLIFRKLA